MTELTVTLPRVAETTDESYVTEFLVSEGESVDEGQAILRVETDKAIVEIPSPAGGVLLTWLIAVDDEVKTGADVAVISTAG